MENEGARASDQRDDIAAEVERKDAEMLKQQERAAKPLEPLKGYDSVDAESFPASDPPPPQTDVLEESE